VQNDLKTVEADIIRPKKDSRRESLPGGEGGFFGFAEKDGRGIHGYPGGQSLPLEGKVSAKQTDEVFHRLPPSE